MSTDVIAYKNVKSGVYGLEAVDYITMFTLSGRLNNYWGVHELITTSHDDILTREDGEKIYVVSKKKINYMLEESKRLNLGEDAETFLSRCLQADCSKVYLQING